MANGPSAGTAKSGITAGAMIASAVTLLALPSAVLAFTTKFEPRISSTSADENLDALPESPPAGLARSIPIRSLAKGLTYPFTPAETPSRPDRSVTVAVRVDSDAARVMSVRRSKLAGMGQRDGTELHIAPTAFNLGVSRGYKNFSQDLVPASKKKSGIDAPDLGQFSLKPTHKGDDSRFSPRIVIDETQATGRTPRTFAGDGDDRVDVGGSYRVTENLDVTAGVRYSQERERLLPALTDGKQDNQAVYVGTQFRF